MPETIAFENPIEDDDDWPEQPASQSSAFRQVLLSADVGGDVENPVADPDIEEVLKLRWTSKPITVRRTMSTSSPKVRQLKPGTTVTVYERGESEGSKRVRIGDDEWATAVTVKGKVLLFDLVALKKEVKDVFVGCLKVLTCSLLIMIMLLGAFLTWWSNTHV